ncbi:MAG: membrane protein insertase YidC [Planctomycetota bacterium]|nr:MAG: membrane protein insertase YidC [Planctomycetota bacterium]
MQPNESPFSPRLALFLVAAAVVLIGWQFTPWASKPQPPQPQRPAVAATDAQAASAPGAGASSQPAAPPEPALPVLGSLIEDATERTETLEFGAPGQPGYMRATFTNRGARLLDLRLGNYFVHGGFDAAAQQQPANWTPLLVGELPAPIGSGLAPLAGGSLALTTSESSAALVRKPLDQVLWTMDVARDAAGAPESVTFRHAPGTGVVFEKVVRWKSGTFELEIELALRNEAAGSSGARLFRFTPAAWMPEAQGNKYYVEPQIVAASREDDKLPELHSQTPSGSVNDLEPGSLTAPGRILYAGAHNKYFAVLLRPLDDVSAAAIQTVRFERGLGADLHAPSDAPRAKQYLKPVLDVGLALPDAGREERRRFALWVGPKQRELFEDDARPELEPFALLVDHDLGMFASIGRLLTGTLRFFHGLVGNWGVAVILLTLLVRVLIFPLNRRSQTAMARHAKKMKRVQPKMDELKQKHAKDPGKLREAQAKLMQEEGLFPPLGGCLPVFLQMPIFFGLFAALRASFDLRQAPFVGWIHDLSLPDQMFELGWRVPLLFTTLDITHFNLLPILMVALWLGQQMTAPKPTDEQALKMQRILMFMPVLMGVFLYDYAAGLSLYMITSSTCAILEQTVIKRIWPIDDTIPDKAKDKPGCALFAKAMERAAEQQKRAQASTPKRKK